MTGNVCINPALRRVRMTIVDLEKQQVLRTLSVCWYRLVSSTQRACVILSSVAFPVLHYFSTLPHERHRF